jgi:ATP-binding cassette, subfamily C, bacterial LapB
MTDQHWFWTPLRQQRKTYFWVIIAAIFINVFALFSAFYVMTVYDKVIPNSALESLAALTIGIGLVIAFDFAMKLVRSNLTDDAGKAIERDVSTRLFQFLERNYQLSNQRQIGSIVNTVREFDSLKEFVSSASFVTFADLPFIFLFLGVLALIGGWVAAVPAVIVVLTVLVALASHPRLQKLSTQTSIESQSKQSILIELLAHMESLKTLAGITLLRDKWIESVDVQAELSGRSKRISQFSSIFAMTGQQIAQVGIVVVGTLLITFDDLSMGGLIACVILSGRTLSPLGQMANLLNRLSQATSAYRSLDAMLGLPSDEEQRSKFSALHGNALDYSLKEVSLQYESQQDRTLGPLSIDLPARSSWGVVGPTGGGKTSLLRLLSGVTSASQGMVLLADSNIQHVNPSSLREHIAVLNQQPAIFTGSIEENIRLGNPDATDADIQEAIQKACLGQFVNNLSDGVKTHLFDRGAHLSGGQRQLICLARLFVSKADIVLLDEPTSALDAETEKKIIESLKEFGASKTLIIVTHRTPLLVLTQRVLVLNQGQIVRDVPTAELFRARQERQQRASDA